MPNTQNADTRELDALIDKFRRADGIINTVIDPFLKEMGKFGVDRSHINILNRGAVDTNELIQGMHYVIEDVSDGIQVVVRPSDKADEYAWFIEHGTRPHWVPIAALIGWASRHGVSPYAVQKSIAEHGTEPRNMFRDTFFDFEEKADKETPSFVDNIFRRILE